MSLRRKAKPLLFAISIMIAGTTPSSADILEDILTPPDRTGILPMETILPQIHDRVPGTITEVELERKHDRWIYEVDVLANDGRKVELKVDAITGSILSQKNKFRKPWE